MTGFWSSNIKVKTILSITKDCHRTNKRWLYTTRGQCAKQYPKRRLASRSQLLVTFVCSLAGWCLVSGPLSAQITPDRTLGTEVNTTDDLTEITGGTKANSNLFHSFQDFSLSTGNTAFFNNGLDINNIISRVTSNNISNIDGLIRANGSANLILINKNGISFGANASLDIGGSFLASTAESVIFEDGTVLNTDLTAKPSITISVPIGLQLGQNSAEIEVSGQGHDLSVGDPLFSPIIFGEQWGIRVKPGQTLALLGRGITIDGGVVAAPGGKIELGSVAEGIVDLDSDSPISLSYENVTAFDNLELRSQGLADASGTESIPGGSIQVQGRQLSLNDGSLLVVQNQSDGEAGAISVDTSESVTVSGTNNNGTIRSSITNETLGTGNGGDLKITTSHLTIDQGANISNATSSNIAGGNIIIDASESVVVKGFSAIDPNNLSFISTSTSGPANSGNINLSTKKLTILDGARVGAGTFGTGLGGDINIQATELIEVIGVEPSQSVASLLGASSLGVGNAGNSNLNTARLVVRDGGRVDSSAAAIGSAGDINIRATESIEVSGQTLGTNEPSRISSGANVENEVVRQLFQLPDVPSGEAGSVIVVTKDLQITDRGEISVINSGLGDGGRLEMKADTIFLDRQGVITAATQSGEGGNILLDADSAIWQGRSLTTATAAGNGNGGNITIDADTVVALENSQVTADAFMGRGGNVEIDAEGSIICESCQISASSELGIEGVVNIETLESTTIDSLEVLQQPTQPQEEVAVACPSNRGASVSQLTIIGRGGLPNRPQKMLNPQSIIEFDAIDNPAVRENQSPSVTKKILPPPARSWYKNARGTIVLTARSARVSPDNSPSTSVNCRVP